MMLISPESINLKDAVEILKNSYPIVKDIVSIVNKLLPARSSKKEVERKDIEKIVKLLKKLQGAQMSQKKVAQSVSRLFPFLEKVTNLRAQCDKLEEIAITAKPADFPSFWENQRKWISDWDYQYATISNPINSSTFNFLPDDLLKKLKEAGETFEKKHTRLNAFLDDPRTDLETYRILLQETKKALLGIEGPVKLKFEELIRAIGYDEI